MDKFSSRKRTLDNNKALTSAQTNMVLKSKSKKYSQEHLNFGFTTSEVNEEEKHFRVICSKIVETIFGDNFAKHLQSILLSNDIVARRIDDIAEDVHQQLFGKLRDKFFSLRLDEATDRNKDSPFIAYV
ncbi:SCAN domain-containing protein 3 [Trichonephila clavipes]|nr:SCAN domain-containing protein 3 [Trichonephila clavipes]